MVISFLYTKNSHLSSFFVSSHTKCLLEVENWTECRRQKKIIIINTNSIKSNNSSDRREFHIETVVINKNKLLNVLLGFCKSNRFPFFSCLHTSNFSFATLYSLKFYSIIFNSIDWQGKIQIKCFKNYTNMGLWKLYTKL